MMHPNFSTALHEIKSAFIHDASRVHVKTWQALDVSAKPDMVTYELTHYFFMVYMRHLNLEKYKHDIKPNLPWADDHFAERVGGEPLNPPPSEAWWPHAKDNSRFKDANGQFSHTYPERYWPKQAGNVYTPQHPDDTGAEPNMGIRYAYGDLNDVVALLHRDQGTRQVYMPIFFPEDTGAVSQQRIPCSLGYGFICRNGHFDVEYHMRSCDAHNHLRDDIYLTVRLVLWLLEQLRDRDHENWKDIKPGKFVMLITSLHCFVNDYRKLIK